MSGGKDRYGHLEAIERDELFFKTGQYKADKHPKATNLVLGAYRGGDGKPYVLDCVKKAEKMILEESAKAAAAGGSSSSTQYPDKEYQAIAGHQGFRDASLELLLGKDVARANKQRIVTFQTISGTGALRLGAEWYVAALKGRGVTPVAYFSNPTWINHKYLFEGAGITDIRFHRYFDRKSSGVDFEGMYEDLSNAPDEAIVVYHVCGHNPTGADLNMSQWEKLADLSKKKNFNVFLDCAYIGLVSGSLVEDAAPVRLFFEKGIDFTAAQSYAKNMGLYGERVGCLHILCESKKTAAIVHQHVEPLVRACMSTPPLYGPRLALKVLLTPELMKSWQADLKKMSQRITDMRQIVYKELVRLGTPGDWEHVVKQVGCFSFLNLSPDQCDRLLKEFHIYLLRSGRTNVAGLTAERAVYLARSIHEVVTTAQKSKM